MLHRVALLFLSAVAAGPGGGNALDAEGLSIELVLDHVVLRHSVGGGPPGAVARAGWALLVAWPGQAKAIELDSAVAVRVHDPASGRKQQTRLVLCFVYHSSFSSAAHVLRR